jgi:hypothetical protein
MAQTSHSLRFSGFGCDVPSGIKRTPATSLKGVAVELCFSDNCPGRVDTRRPGQYDRLIRRCDGPTECCYEWTGHSWELTVPYLGFPSSIAGEYPVTTEQ